MRRSARLSQASPSSEVLAKEECSSSGQLRHGAAIRDHNHDVDESDAYQDASASDELEPARRPAKRRKVAAKLPAAAREKKKKPKLNKADQKPLSDIYIHIFPSSSSSSPPPLNALHPSLPPPPRPPHGLSHHQPRLLLSPASRPARAALLAWFDTVFSARPMPWRKPFLDPAHHPRDVLARRAYEVWISEVMLQQTRVAVASAYWLRWTARWPSLPALAAAAEDDVLAMWRGLGYYARARRAWQAARQACASPAGAGGDGSLPDTAEALRGVPGIGRYTAGAVAAIVWGRAEPMVDGNVVRVLCRQMGIRGEPKADRRVDELVWETAGRLVRAVVRDGGAGVGENGGAQEEEEDDDDDDDGNDELVAPSCPSDRPGRWGQALMELGSTVCTPKPNCGACPITATCRAYGEGLALAARKGLVPGVQPVPTREVDIEDACDLCVSVEEETGSGEEEEEEEKDDRRQASVGNMDKKAGKPKRRTSAFFAAAWHSEPSRAPSKQPARAEEAGREPWPTAAPAQPKPSPKALEIIALHARRYPHKTAKKAVREEETLVCAIRRRRREGGGGEDGEEAGDGKWEYLIHRRPDKGLLAGMWELPSRALVEGGEAGCGGEDVGDEPRGEKATMAVQFVEGLLGLRAEKGDQSTGRRPNTKATQRTIKSTAHGGTGQLRTVAGLGSVPWLFSHIKLTMHVYLFELTADGGALDRHLSSESTKRRWASTGEVEAESMGTGMRKCWTLVRDAA